MGKWLTTWLLPLFVRPFSWLLRKMWGGLGKTGLSLRRLLSLFLHKLWGLLGRMGLALRVLLARFVLPPARWLVQRLGMLLAPVGHFLGRMGLAMRNLLNRFVVQPVRGLVRRLALIIGPPWRLLGRMGVAFRRLLTRFVWRPLLFLTAPWRLLFRRHVLPWLPAFLLRPFRAAGHSLRALWQAGAGRRHHRRQLWHSRWLIYRARLRFFLLRPRPPRGTLVIPSSPRQEVFVSPQRRITRLATTGLAVGLVIVASFATAQQAPRLSGVKAENQYQLSSSKFGEEPALPTPTALPPTPVPSATPVASPTPWPTPDPLNSGGSVAFTLRQNGNSDIYALSIGQDQPVRLTNDPAGERDPAWSPDGSELAFASHRDGNWEIYVLALEDGSLRRLTDDPAFDAGPAWSPDGQWLVFESYRSGNLDLYIISRDGEQGPVRLTQDPAPDFSPVWSPGGRQIAFTSWRGGNKDIFLMYLDAPTDERARNMTSTPGLFEDDASFSPDGQQLAYTEDSSGFQLVFTQFLNNGDTPVGDPVSRGQGQHPAWSPDGKALSYVHRKVGQSHLIASSLDAWAVAPQAFTTSGYISAPSWSARTLPLPLPPHLLAINESPSNPHFVEGVAEAEGARAAAANPTPEGTPGAEAAATQAEATPPPYLLQELPVNAPSPYLSDRVDQSFSALRQRVIAESGWDFLGQVAQLFEPINARPLPGQTDRTWNKAGRAFDYESRYPLAFEPQVEIMREDGESTPLWRTYLRTAAQDGSQGEPLRDLPWDFRARYGAEPQYYDQGGKWKDAIPAGYYIDFTALAADYGWERVSSSDNWRTFFPGILYWHYENRQGLNWEQAMLELYTVDEILRAFR